MIKGYKSFNHGLINNFNQKLYLDKLYTLSKEVKYKSNGFHLCTNLEDTLRYVDGINEEIDICKVTGYEDYIKFDDEYYGYYNMYCCKGLIINRVLTHEEIVNYMLETNDLYRIVRFVQGYKLFEEDILKISDNIKDESKVLKKTIDYYQRNDLEAFRR